MYMLQVIYFISQSISNDKTWSLKWQKNFKTKILFYLENALAEISWHALQVCELVFKTKTRINYAIKLNISKLQAIKKQ